jgi:hypothetical protein
MRWIGRACWLASLGLSLAAVALLAVLVGCRRRRPDVDRAALVGTWVYDELDLDHEGLTRGREVLELRADGTCADVFTPVGSPPSPAPARRGTWRVERDELVSKGCLPVDTSSNATYPIGMLGDDLTFYGEERAFVYRRRR